MGENVALLPLVLRPSDVVRRPMILAIVALALAVVPSAIGWWRLRADALQRDQERFEAAMHESVDAFNKEVVRHLVLLGNLRGQIGRHSDKITEAEWRRLLEFAEWRTRFPHLRAIGYAELTQDGALVIRWIDYRRPPVRWQSGFDLLSLPAVLPAWERARNGRSPELSAELGLEEKCALAVQSVYREGEQKALRGCVFAEIAVDEFYQDTLPAVSRGVLTVKPLAAETDGPPSSAFSRNIMIAPCGYQWWLHFAPGPSFSRESQQEFAWLVLAGGLLGGGLLAGLTWTQAHARIRSEKAQSEITALKNSLEQRVAERTAALHATQAELRQSLDKEREIAQLKTSFVNMVSHEFRTPLGVILSSADILDAHLERLNPGRRREHLHTIQRCTQQMAVMLENVLLLGRIESGKSSFAPQRIDLSALAQRITDEVTSATNARCFIDCRLEAFADDTAGDESLLRHIFANLLSNAVKYSSAGSSVLFHITRTREMAVCTVQDRGIGIPAADLTRLFDAFQRGSNVGEISGTGLGMTIVKCCVEMHNGHIEIHSKEDEGTTVIVRLPLFHPDSNDENPGHRRSTQDAGEPVRDADPRGVCGALS